jgi:murein DD-endopeptidase MepM/ murein hydrolase activator NlpD
MKFRYLFLILPLIVAACASGPTRMETGGMQTVLVRPGETIDDLAKRLNISPRDLIEANGLTPPYKVAGGETLIVPVPKHYTVKKGDSVSKIAERFNVSQIAIAQLNHLSPPYTLRIGQNLTLPDFHGQDPQPITTAVASVPATQPKQPPAAAAPATPDTTDRSSPAALAPPVQTAAIEKPSEPNAAASGFIWPLKGEIVSGFGPKAGGLHNDGINIAAAEGTPVKASAAGTVAYAGDDLKGFGNLVLIRHSDGWITAYAHLASMTVSKGEEVNAAQVIGTVGQTGSVDSPQLHFELRHGKEAVDPTGKLG